MYLSRHRLWFVAMETNGPNPEIENFEADVTAQLRLPDAAHPRIGSFYRLWQQFGKGDVPEASAFDLRRLSADYPFVARIGARGPDFELIWHEVTDQDIWPFSTPMTGEPLLGMAPQSAVARVVSALHRTLSSGVPDYFETTSWMYDGRTLSIARLVVPVAVPSGRELILVWETLEPPSVVL